jgi:hypothetical protein
MDHKALFQSFLSRRRTEASPISPALADILQSCLIVTQYGVLEWCFDHLAQ